jgi:single-strand DNA-binding protein
MLQKYSLGALVELTGRVSTRAWTANNGELRSKFHTSIKLHGSSKKNRTYTGYRKTRKYKIIIESL